MVLKLQDAKNVVENMHNVESKLAGGSNNFFLGSVFKLRILSLLALDKSKVGRKQRNCVRVKKMIELKR